MEVKNRKGFFQPSLWIFIFFIVNELKADLQSEAEVLQHCCLGALKHMDGKLNFFNRNPNNLIVHQSNITSILHQFIVRFERAHNFDLLETDELEILGKAIATTNPSLELFIQPKHKPIGKIQDVSAAIRVYSELLRTANRIKKNNNGLVIGIYLDVLLDNMEHQLEAVEAVFGPRENSSFPIGLVSQDCSKLQGLLFTLSYDRATANYFQRMQFITCRMKPNLLVSPEIHGMNILSMYYRISSVYFFHPTPNLNILVSYPSHGISNQGVVSNLAKYKRFWCEMNHLLGNYTSGAKIVIMDSAFDDSHASRGETEDALFHGKYHTGWWSWEESESYLNYKLDSENQKYVMQSPTYTFTEKIYSAEE